MEKRSQSTTQKGIHGILWNFSGSVFQIILQFVVIGVLARLLSPEEFGIVAVMMILVTFSELFSRMGIGSALVQIPKITSKHISQGYTLSLGIGLLIGMLFYYFAPLVGAFFDLENVDNALQFFALFFPLRSINGITGSLLTRKLQFPILVKCGVISYFLGIGAVSIILAFLDFGFWALIWGQFASIMITMVIFIYHERPSFSFDFQKHVVKDLLFFGSGQTLGGIFNYFAENADNIVVGKALGTVAMGVYSKAFQLLAVPASFFSSIFDKVLFPILSQKQEQIKKLASFYLFSTSLTFGFLIPIGLLLCINGELIVDLLLGSQWGEVVLPMQILILGLAFRFASKINKSYLKSLGLVYRSAYYQFIFAVLMFGCCFLGSRWNGLPGVAGGVLVATILNYFQMAIRLLGHLGLSKTSLITIFLKTLGYNIFFLVITLILYHFDLVSKWLHLGLSLFFYAPIMVFTLLSKKNIIFNDDNHEMLSQIFQSFPDSIQKLLRKSRFFVKYYG